MITLKELVLRQQMSGETDNELLVDYFLENDVALEGIEFISKLAKKKIEDDKWKYGKLCGDLSMYQATKQLLRIFGQKDGFIMDYYMRNWIICYHLEQDFNEKFPTALSWIKEKIEAVNCPQLFWRPFYDWLHEQEIYFKDENKDNVNK